METIEICLEKGRNGLPRREQSHSFEYVLPEREMHHLNNITN